MGCLLMVIVFITSVESLISKKELSLQPGGNITIPCHYNKRFIQHKKYWCYDAGSAFNYCKIQAYANNTADRVTVTDYPDQNLFTVTMRNLQTGDTGSYWCAVEIEGLKPDVHKQFYITVKSDPVVSVVESSVGGQEGGVVRVQCIYSAGYQSEQKQWCRSKDRRCYTVGRRTDTSQNSAVQINDDGRSRSFSVEMSGLKKSDAGWYWCRVGKLEVPVHLSVSRKNLGTTTTIGKTEADITETLSPAVTTSATVNHTSISNSSFSSEKQREKDGSLKLLWPPLAVAGLGLLLLILVSIITCVLRRKYKETQPERISNAGVHTTSATEDSITYSTVLTTNKARLFIQTYLFSFYFFIFLLLFFFISIFSHFLPNLHCQLPNPLTRTPPITSNAPTH
uniref:Ig-like domain-containing protein n=1 Tax=Astyanax mexicanus TaxID=7994 RepID=W5L3L8_ASTMX